MWQPVKHTKEKAEVVDGQPAVLCQLIAAADLYLHRLAVMLVVHQLLLDNLEETDTFEHSLEGILLRV